MNQEDKAKEMKHKAQSALEYVVFIAILVAALIAMQTYFKRGIQGRLRSQAEELSGGTFYSLGATNANSTVNRTIIENSRSYSENNTDISESNTTVNQTTNKTEELLSFGEEPRR